MNRVGLLAVVLIAALASACGGDDAPAAPTAPTPPPVATPPPSPPPNPSCAPSTPGNFRVSVSGTTRTFAWNTVSNAVDYTILIGSSPGGSDLISTNTSQPAYVWSGHSPGTYYARVYARNTCGSSANTPELIFN